MKVSLFLFLVDYIFRKHSDNEEIDPEEINFDELNTIFKSIREKTESNGNSTTIYNSIEFKAGSVIGEISLYYPAINQATIIANEDSVVWYLTKEEFMSKFKIHSL